MSTMPFQCFFVQKKNHKGGAYFRLVLIFARAYYRARTVDIIFKCTAVKLFLFGSKLSKFQYIRVLFRRLLFLWTQKTPKKCIERRFFRAFLGGMLGVRGSIPGLANFTF